MHNRSCRVLDNRCRIEVKNGYFLLRSGNFFQRYNNTTGTAMALAGQEVSLIHDIQYNCNISDARDHGIYSMCTMVLKLRNLYKWEYGLEPWEEAEPGDLLDWIDGKEQYWKTISGEDYRMIDVKGRKYAPNDPDTINLKLADEKLIYGAGYGRSMKAVFFLAEQMETRQVAGCPVKILGRAMAKEMASPVAMVQDGMIYIHRDSLRFFVWDQIQELRSSCRSAFVYTLKLYDLLADGELDQNRFRDRLDTMVDDQMDLFIYHEVGELKEATLDSAIFHQVVTQFPTTIIELVSRSIKDVLADTHPDGLLAYAIREQKETSLSLYVGLLDGLRKHLFPQIFAAWQGFIKNGDWQTIEEARVACRNDNLALAEKIRTIASEIGVEPDERVERLFQEQIVAPLGLAATVET